MDDAVRGRYQAAMAAFVQSPVLHQPGRRAVGWWLVALALLIAAMVVVGGLTRLTGSGLSITEWHPVTGAVPPLSDQAWQSEFAKYQHIPQYKFEHRGMTVAEFKTIYWWEWTHRLLGRLIGFAFLLPFLYFVATRAIRREGVTRMVVLFALGGLQGFVGWWMVESGLETRVSVSQYRLAIHLGVALILYAAILWTAFEYLTGTARLQTRNAPKAHSAFPPPLRSGRGASGDARSQWLSLLFVALVYLQMLLGALVAGLHAGLVYNTWPSMDGRVFPEGASFSKPWWINFFENAGLAQFDHRVGAYLIAAGAVWLWIVSRNRATRIRSSANAVLAVAILQATLGVLTLVNQVPVPLAALHQITAVALLSAALWHAFELSPALQTAEST